MGLVILKVTLVVFLAGGVAAIVATYIRRSRTVRFRQEPRPLPRDAGTNGCRAAHTIARVGVLDRHRAGAGTASRIDTAPLRRCSVVSGCDTSRQARRERSRMFSRPTDAERDRRRADLLQRAELVRTRGWDDYRAVWSTGEIVGVAALLAITRYFTTSTRLCNQFGPDGHSICGALLTARPTSTTTANKPAAGSSTPHRRSEVPVEIGFDSR